MTQPTEQEITFPSDGIELAGNLHLPSASGEHPAFVVLHGFAGSKNNSHAELMARLLAAWGYALQANGGDQTKARAYVTELFRHVPILDSGARGATITFAQRNQGDVLLAWEDDAVLAVQELGRNRLEIVLPSVSIQAEPVVAVVDAVVDRHGTRAQAEAYLRYLYTPEGQEIIARNHYRPIEPTVAARHAAEFPAVPTFTVDAVFGGWRKAQAEHFADGGLFDQIYQPGQ